MGKRVRLYCIIASLAATFSLIFNEMAMATIATVEEQEPKYKYVTKPSERLVIEKVPCRDKLVCDMTGGVVQGVDSNPLLDSTKKADNYTEETLDVHYKYPLVDWPIGATNARFGINMVNINYYNITDVNIFDGVADVRLEQEIGDKTTLSLGYALEALWFPNDENGNFIGNEINAGIRQKLTGNTYHRVVYRLLFRDYLKRKARLGNFDLSEDLRADKRNVFEYEFGIYPTNKTKIRIVSQYYVNDSNDQYQDYYDYLNYRIGGSIIQFLTKRLYSIAGFYYQMRNYDSRRVSDRDAIEQDNLYLVTTSFLYDITKSTTAFVNYSHSENHTNEPLEKYSNSLYSAGLYYSF